MRREVELIELELMRAKEALFNARSVREAKAWHERVVYLENMLKKLKRRPTY